MSRQCSVLVAHANFGMAAYSQFQGHASLEHALLWNLKSKFLTSWWRHQMETFPRYWSFVRGIHRSPMNSPHKGQWRGALMFSLICAWINHWVNNREAGDLRRHRAHYDVIVMFPWNAVGGTRVSVKSGNCSTSELLVWTMLRRISNATAFSSAFSCKKQEFIR